MLGVSPVLNELSTNKSCAASNEYRHIFLFKCLNYDQLLSSWTGQHSAIHISNE